MKSSQAPMSMLTCFARIPHCFPSHSPVTDLLLEFESFSWPSNRTLLHLTIDVDFIVQTLTPKQTAELFKAHHL